MVGEVCGCRSGRMGKIGVLGGEGERSVDFPRSSGFTEDLEPRAVDVASNACVRLAFADPAGYLRARVSQRQPTMLYRLTSPLRMLRTLCYSNHLHGSVSLVTASTHMRDLTGRSLVAPTFLKLQRTVA